MAHSSSLVSVIVASYNKKELLRSCLVSVYAQSYSPLEVFVIDNASSDATAEMVRCDFPSAHLIVNERNDYFSAAYNRGIRLCRGPFVLCLNNDIVLERCALERLMEKTAFDSCVGMWGGKMLRPDKKTIDSTGLFLGKNRKPLERGYNQFDHGQYEIDGYVFGINGAAILCRREMLDDIAVDGEYFDEDFKIFCEDLDLCWRAHRFGWRAYYVSKTLIFHARGASARREIQVPRLLKKFYFPQLPRELQVHMVKNRYGAIIKNDSPGALLGDCLFIFAYEMALWGFLLLCVPKTAAALFRSGEFFKKTFKKRKIISAVLKTKKAGE